MDAIDQWPIDWSIIIHRIESRTQHPISDWLTTPRHTPIPSPQPTEAADFQRLIKLSYMVSYTEEDGRALNKEELLRLLVLANGYEMVWCVEECAQACGPSITTRRPWPTSARCRRG